MTSGKTEPNLLEKPARKRRSKAEIEADRRAEEEKRHTLLAAAVREELIQGKTLKGKVASALLAQLGANWEQLLQPDGKISDCTMFIQQRKQLDVEVVQVRIEFVRRVEVGSEYVIDDGSRELPLA